MSSTGLATAINYLTARRYGILFFAVISCFAAALYRDFLFFNKGYVFSGIASDSLFAFYPWFYYYTSHILDLSLRFWTFDFGLGAPTIHLLHDYFLGNPLYIFAVVAGPENLPRSLAYIAAANVIIAGTIFYAFMRTLNITPLAAAYAGIAYAFSAYMVSEGFWHHYPNYAIFLALMLLFMERFLRTGSWLPFVLILGFLEVKAILQIGQVLIFLTVYLVYRRVDTVGWNTKDIVSRLILLFSLYALGCALNALFSLPELYTIFHSSRAFDNLPTSTYVILSFLSSHDETQLVTLFARLFSNDLLGWPNSFTGWANYLEAPAPYVGALTIIMAILASLHARGRHLAANLILGAFFGAWALLPAVRYIMNAGQSLSYKHTNLYFGTILILLAAKGIDGLLRKQIKIRPSDILSVFVLLLLLTLLFVFQSDLNSHLKATFVINSRSFAIVMLYLTAYAALLAYALAAKEPIAILRFLIVIAISEILVNSMATVNAMVPVAVDVDFAEKKADYFSADTNGALSYIKDRDRSFYRISKSYNDVFLDDNMVQGYHGVAAYLGYNDASIVEYYELLDLPRSETRPLYSYLAPFGNRWISQSLVDVKYYLTNPQNSLVPYGFEFVASQGKVNIYRNENALPIGALYHTCIDRDAFEKYSIDQREALMTKAVVLARCPQDLRKADMSGADLAAIAGRPIRLTSDRITSANLRMTGGDQIDTFKYVATTEDPQLTLDLRGLDFPNLMKIEIVYDNDVNNDEHFFWRKADEPFNAERGANWSTENGHKRRVLILDPKKVDFLRISIGTKKGANVRIESLRVEAVDPKVGADALSSLHIHDGGLKVISDQYIAGKIKTDKPGLLFVSVPFSVGWSATVNGRPAQIEKANIALIGIPVGAGTSEVTLSYFPPGLMQGLLVSGLSLLATIALFWRFPRIKMSGDFEQRP